ncbi:hypothetical protein QYM36_011071 [Artemia franciscana]|uniref:Glycosyl hydrolase-like 10 domain-containing protein n=1 Tax=Artemia franciscana TaxID=6661 RepID=A0AA88KYG0_ARTSF|nr:hypothetical protein QYM36_011071 [Artemia franciscana]
MDAIQQHNVSYICSSGADVGCSSYYDPGLAAYGTCVRNGCCAYSAQITESTLCDQAPAETCCFRNNVCSDDFCFDVYGTWVSQYRFSGSQADVDQGFAALKEKGVKRVLFNVWANGVIFANSATAQAAGVQFGNDRLAWAVQSARQYGLELYAWFEYGSMACYGSAPSNQFANTASANGWLLYNMVNGQPVYNTDGTGDFVFMDISLQPVRDFLVGISRDIVANYDIDGIQYDDHFALPSGFSSVDSMGQSSRYSQTESLMQAIKDASKSIKPSIHVSFSPSSLLFSRSKHNVDWADWVLRGVVEEVMPQYYRTTAADFKRTLEEDLALITRSDQVVAGIRLSGSSFPENTPQSEVDQMIQISYSKGLKGISFWFADNVILGPYFVPFLRYC